MKNLLLLLFVLPLSCLSYVLASRTSSGNNYSAAVGNPTALPADTTVSIQDTIHFVYDSTVYINGKAYVWNDSIGIEEDTTIKAVALEQASDTIVHAEDSILVFQPEMLDSARAEVKPVKEEPVYAKGKIWRTAVMEEAMKLYTGLKYDEAFSKFREAGSYGEGAAFYFIGRMYQYGELRRSAAMPDSPEPSNPELYFIQNDDSAKFYFQQALDHNSLLGNLGFAEYNVVRSEEDKQRFLRLMRSAAVEIRERAVEGDAFCNRILGSMYYTGYGEMKDLEFAFLYLSKAAEKKDVVSYTSLANMYLSGEGVKKDEKKAIEWLQKGVDAGDKEALYTLGLVYEEGLAGTSDSEQARKLYHKAIQKGSAIAFEQLKYLNQTPDQKLVIASFTRNSEMIKKSLTAGAKINTRAVPEGYDQDFRNRTPLMHAVYIPVLLEDFGVIYVPEVRGQAISLLLKNKADVNATDQDGRTALHYTLQGARISTDFFEREQAELLDTLLHYGADPNKVDKQGNAPLYYALLATNGQHEMELGRLLAGGASPNIQNEEGKTVLMLACELKASNEVILRLIQAGANTRMRDNSGKAAIDYTTNEAVINILMAAGSPEARK